MTRLRVLQERTSFLGYDEHCRENLKALHPLLTPAIDDLLDDFYQFMRGRPETRDLLPTGEVLLRARQAQKEHWQQLLSGEALGEAHCARAIQIGRAHERIGLGLSAYLSGYCIVLNGFCALIAAHYRDDAAAMGDKIQSVQKAVFLDIDFVIESYLDAKNASIRKILSNADHFIAEIEQIESELADLGGGLKPKAETLAASLANCRAGLGALRQTLPDGECVEQIEPLQAAFAACEDIASAIGGKYQIFSLQLERLSSEVAARRERHRLNFDPPAPQGFLTRLKKAAQVLFPGHSV